MIDTHSMQRDILTLLQCNEISTTLTNSLAMHPAASVSGFYLSHPQAQYFNVALIGGDQICRI